jgi:subtilisin family serine protease
MNKTHNPRTCFERLATNNKIVLVPLFFFLLLFSCEINSASVSSELSDTSIEPPQTALPSVAGSIGPVSKPLQARLATQTNDQHNDVIVMLKLPEKAKAFQKIVGSFHIKNEFSVFHGFAARMTKAQILALSNNPSVFEIQEDAAVTAYIADATSDFGINAAGALASPALGGDGVGICVIDTGVDISHQQTNQHVFAFCDVTTTPAGCNVDAGGNAITSGEPAAYDDQGHGTAVVSAAAGDGQPNATYTGVARNAGVAAAKVLNSSGSGSASDVIKGIEWCTGLPAVKILNLSLGENTHTSETNALTFAANCVADPAWSIGGMNCAYPGRPAKVVVAAAGNSGPAQYQVFSPGEAEKVITVGAAYNKTEGGNALAAFSSRGPTLNEQVKPDLVAPGANVTTAYKWSSGGGANQYAARSGTSFSTPIVTGVVALMLEADPSLTPAEIKFILEETAQHWGSPGKNIDWGAGQMDAYAAIQRALGAPPGSVTPWGFPGHAYLTGHLEPDLDNTLDGNEEWLYPFALNNSSLPIGVTTIIDGDWTCDWWFVPFFDVWDCASTAEGPELDTQILGPGGAIIDTSACPVPSSSDPTCGNPSISGNLYGTEGRQEMHVIKPPAGGFAAGTYTLRVYRAADTYGIYDGSQAADFLIELQNAAAVSSNNPPVVSTSNDSFSEGTPKVYSANWVDTDGVGQIHACTINFGDGAGAQAGTISPAQPSASGTCSLTHTYADGTANYPISLTVTDGIANGNASATATVNNINPQINSVTNDGPKEINQAVTVSVLATDPAGANDPLSYQFDCDNNGSYEVGPQTSNSASCTHTAEGGKTVKVQVMDGDGGIGSSSTSFSITGGSSGMKIHVADLDGQKNPAGKNKWNAVVTVYLNPAVSGASANGSWSTGAVSNCTTSGGSCSMQLSNIANTIASVTFTMNNVALAGYSYAPSLNTDPDSDSNGTTIAIPSSSSPPPSSVATVTASGTAIPLNGGKWRTDLTMTATSSGSPINGAAINGSWSTSGTSACTTDGSGTCTVIKNNIASGVTSITYSITNVSGYSLSVPAPSFTINKP